MANKKVVIVKKSKDYEYEIHEHASEFRVWRKSSKIGTTRTYEDALMLVKTHAGADIEKIR